jgi:hypothetical protein
MHLGEPVADVHGAVFVAVLEDIDLVCGWQHIDPGDLLAEDGVEQAGLAGFYLADHDEEEWLLRLF